MRASRPTASRFVGKLNVSDIRLMVRENELGDFHLFDLEIVADEDVVDLAVIGVGPKFLGGGAGGHFSIGICVKGIDKKLTDRIEDLTVGREVEVTHEDNGIFRLLDESGHGGGGVLCFRGSKTEMCYENINISAVYFNDGMQNGAGFIVSIFGVARLVGGVGNGIGFGKLDLVLCHHTVSVSTDAVFVDERNCGRESAFVACNVTDELCHFDSAASGELVVDLVQTADIGLFDLDVCAVLRFSVNDGTVIGTKFKAASAGDVIGHDLEFHSTNPPLS